MDPSAYFHALEWAARESERSRPRVKVTLKPEGIEFRAYTYSAGGSGVERLVLWEEFKRAPHPLVLVDLAMADVRQKVVNAL